MKSMFILLVTLMIWDQQLALDSITKAISTGNVTALEPYLDKSVEIAILEQENVYGKTEAIQILKNFFGKNKPQTFSQMHTGQSKGKEAQYSIGNLTTSAGTFRVYIYARVEADKYYVQELRFDKE
ncbi:DUF4783 domain-containing protein [Haliscomenobacter sp.]|uniref:DUF4783 domain-containing protein n=1 Tax=Haliscomenobacter sp. TaxID=2717303 RepID=UPI003BAB26C4